MKSLNIQDPKSQNRHAMDPFQVLNALVLTTLVVLALI